MYFIREFYHEETKTVNFVRGKGGKFIKTLELLDIMLSRKLNDAISGRVFYADFGTPQGNQSL